jgi:hypothetical protein
MPRGYRGIILTLAGLALIGANPVSDDARGNPTTAQSDESADKKEDVASGISRISEALEAQNAKTDPYEEDRNKREIRDLQAQENSAYWTQAMFWATACALVLSFIGIGLVWTTFRETRQANKIARDHQRARILPSAALIRTQHMTTDVDVVLRCENIGLSPAYRVRGFVLPVTAIPNLPPADAIGGHERAIKVGETDDLTIIPNFENDHFIVGMIRYETIFGGPKFSYFCFGFTWSQQSRKWFAVSQIPDTWPKDT